MDQRAIQAKIWKGYGKAAQKLGSDFQFYRPSFGRMQLEDGGGILLEDGGSLLTEDARSYLGKPLFIRRVSLNAEDMKYGRPNKYGKSTWYALMDATGMKPGDYFVGRTPDNMLLEDGGNIELEDSGDMQLEGDQNGTFFIAALQPLLPILVVECNRTITLFRPQAQSGAGAQPYSGMTAANEKALVTGVPCSILQGTKGEKNETALPGDTRTPWWTVLMPASVGRVKYGDLIIDDFGQRYIVSSPELTDLGYRLNCAMTIA